MKKRFMALLFSAALVATVLTGCGEKNVVVEREATETNEQVVSEQVPEAEKQESTNSTETETEENIPVTVRVGGLKGATTLGLLPLMEKATQGSTDIDYEFTMVTAADEMAAKLMKSEVDIALIPANLASVLYNKTEGGISVIDINTLGVLYMVSADNSISSPKDLMGKTIYLTGKGTTPDYVLQYILKENNISDKVTLEYKSEATEVAALLEADSTGTAIGLLPQPFVTVACAQNERLSIVMDMNEEWNKAAGDGSGSLVTGVTVVRNDFLNEHRAMVDAFITEHMESVKAVNEDVDNAAALAVKAGIIPKEPIAKKAIPKCNITCITGNEMKEALSGYLKVLYAMDAGSVGGQLPDEDFYY